MQHRYYSIVSMDAVRQVTLRILHGQNLAGR